jgi:2-polyprenyl-3-methyl-5-hydroxy-6-metoxy-1,4-benzoquinol methylase
MDIIKIFKKDGFDIVKCRACGLEFTDSDPSHSSLKELYGEKYFKSRCVGTSYADYMLEEEAMTINAGRRIANIDRIKPAKGRILDVGCAAGFFLNVAKRDWEASGVELSEYASSYARDHFGVQIFNGMLKDASFRAGTFDVVTMWDVIEHLADPISNLKEARRVMKDDGLLVMTTGDAGSMFARICGRGWHLYNPTQHLSYFSKETIASLLKRCGFDILKIEKEGNYFTIGYLASSLAMYYPSILTKAINKAVSPIKSLKICLDLKDIMTVYAVKSG